MQDCQCILLLTALQRTETTLKQKEVSQSAVFLPRAHPFALCNNRNEQTYEKLKDETTLRRLIASLKAEPLVLIVYMAQNRSVELHHAEHHEREETSPCEGVLRKTHNGKRGGCLIRSVGRICR